jgi:hypothetical protein
VLVANVFLVCIEMQRAMNLTIGHFTGIGGDVLILEGECFQTFAILEICARTDACFSRKTPVACTY